MSLLVDIRRNDRGLFLGNSKTQGDVYGTQPPTPAFAPVVKWHYVLAQAFRSMFPTGVPTFITSGVAGDTVGAIVSGLANRAYQWSPDWIVLEVTTNDCTNPTSNAQYTTDVASLLTGLTTASNYNTGIAPRWIFWVLPNAIGESWPNGTNLFDTTATGIDAKAALAISGASGFPTVLVWNPRTAVLAWETVFNPAADPSGHLMTGFDGLTGKHEITTGAEAMSGWLLDNVFGGIPASLPQFPVFTFVP